MLGRLIIGHVICRQDCPESKAKCPEDLNRDAVASREGPHAKEPSKEPHAETPCHLTGDPESRVSSDHTSPDGLFAGGTDNQDHAIQPGKGLSLTKAKERTADALRVRVRRRHQNT